MAQTDWLLFMIRNQNHKISCLTVTTGRLELLEKSVHCYVQQTYDNKELVVLSQGTEEMNQKISDYLRSLNRSDIIFQEAPPSLSLGAMRNASVELATGSIMCQWDDDDLYHPDRIMTQYKHLMSDRRNVGCAYSSFLKFFAKTKKLYWCDWSGEGTELTRLLCGAVMFHKRIFHEFGSLIYPQEGDQCHVEEDLNVLQKLFMTGRVAPVNKANHYFYVYHGENTYDLEHHELTLLTNSGKVVLDEESLLAHRDILEDTFSVVGIEECAVCSKEEIAFTYTA